MKLLVIDDDENKLRQMLSFLAATFPDLTLEDRRSYQSGLKALLLDPPDLMLLDMTMPTFDMSNKERGGRERRYAGQLILDELDRKEIIIPVIIVTQFEQFGDGKDRVTLGELKTDLAQSFPQHYLATIYYQAGNSKWMGELRTVITQAIQNHIPKDREHDDSPRS
jgi:CheY-like chemotaxis protein